MTLTEAIEQRHSVRQYDDRQIPEDAVSALRQDIEVCNRESGLHIQLVLNEPKAFDCMMAHYGKFSGVQNYIAMIGSKRIAEELCGYYGERLVLLAQTLGLNTCWVAMTFKKIRTAFQIDKGEKLFVVIALGYGITQGRSHKSKALSDLSQYEGEAPQWFLNGMKAVQLAPTAMNQQKFLFIGKGNAVQAKAKRSFHTKIDLGIAKYHFEIGAGKEHFHWT